MQEGNIIEGNFSTLKKQPITNVGETFQVSIKTRLARPVFLARVQAGFPSPADDYIEGSIDLNRDIIKHPLATFYIKAIGDSMQPVIDDGELLVVDCAVQTKTGDIVIAVVGTEMCVKELYVEDNGKIWLFSKNPVYPPIEIIEEMDFQIWGKVICSIKLY